MRRPLSTALALAAGAVFVQACSTPEPTRDAAMGPMSPAGDRPAASAPATPYATASPGAGHDGGFSPAAATLVAAPRAAVAAGTALRSPRAARDLAGLTDGQLLSVMGEPDLKRNEETAQAWLYRSTVCLLDVFLEAEGPNDEPRVVLAATRPIGDSPVAEEACLRGLARTRAGLRRPFQP